MLVYFFLIGEVRLLREENTRLSRELARAKVYFIDICVWSIPSLLLSFAYFPLISSNSLIFLCLFQLSDLVSLLTVSISFIWTRPEISCWQILITPLIEYYAWWLTFWIKVSLFLFELLFKGSNPLSPLPRWISCTVNREFLLRRLTATSCGRSGGACRRVRRTSRARSRSWWSARGRASRAHSLRAASAPPTVSASLASSPSSARSCALHRCFPRCPMQIVL